MHPLDISDVTSADLLALRDEAATAGDRAQVALCRVALGEAVSAAATLRSQGLVYRRNVLSGAGPARSGWWRVEGANRIHRFVGATAPAAAKRLCVDAINAARAAVAS